MEKKIFRIRYEIQDKETKRPRTRRIYNVMAIDLKNAIDMLKKKWFAFEIEILDVLSELSLEEYIIEKSSGAIGGELLYKIEEDI